MLTLLCCVTEVSCPRHLTWYHTQSHYPDTASVSPSSSPQVWVLREEQLVPFLKTLVCRGPGSNLWPQVSRSAHSIDWATGADTPLVRTWRYCTCMCKLLMLRCSRSIQMLHNVKKNNIDLFEVHAHVSSFQIHVQVQLQINLKCTDADNMIRHECTFGTPNYWKKRQVTLIKKVLILLKIILS